ncbi:MAG: hypothetical protein JSV65_14400 [Armatimonadota bacterium]|nr:MAG: hypothetical protein JSV65_14400 [Armatimonadota bacterium]
MRRKLRIWLVPLLLPAVLAASCAAQREKEVTELVTQYLDYEVAGNYHEQHALIDSESAKTLPIPVGDIPNPFDPKQLAEYEVKDVEVEGATARADIRAVFQIIWQGGQGLPEEYDLSVYVVHQPQEWKVDELKTRMAWLDTVVAPGAGDNWLMVEQNRRLTQGH